MKAAVVATAIAAACAAGPFVIGGCGPGVPPPAHPASAADGGANGSNEGGAGPEWEGVLSLDALAARGATEAPLMREVLRVERAAPRSPDIRAERDLCVRALFAASRPARVWLADETGAVRGDVASGPSGPVPPRGPACAKKGESLHLMVEAESGVAARAVIFAAP